MAAPPPVPFPAASDLAPSAYVECALFPPPCSSGDLSSFRRHCHSAASAMALAHPWVRESFRLEVYAPKGSGSRRWTAHPNYKHHDHAAGRSPFVQVPHLWTSMDVGASVDDAWVVLAIVAEITKEVPGSAAAVWDEQGDFVLIEAADHLPLWASAPEHTLARSFAVNGTWRLVSPDMCPRDAPLELLLESARLPESDAPDVWRCASARVRLAHDEAGRAHRANAVLPTSTACTFDAHPWLAGAALDAFLARDRSDTAAACAMVCHGCADDPEAFRQRFVARTVQIPRLIFARWRAFGAMVPPRRSVWHIPGYDNASQKLLDAMHLGMHMSMGMEMLAAQETAPSDAPVGDDDLETTARARAEPARMARVALKAARTAELPAECVWGDAASVTAALAQLPDADDENWRDEGARRFERMTEARSEDAAAVDAAAVAEAFSAFAAAPADIEGGTPAAIGFDMEKFVAELRNALGDDAWQAAGGAASGGSNGRGSDSSSDDEDGEDESDDGEDESDDGDFDADLIEGLVKSFEAQGGEPGPASTFAGLANFKLPFGM